MSVSALNNTNYYVPNVSVRSNSQENNTESVNVANQTQVQQVDETNAKVQATPEGYAINQENTSSNNSENQAPIYTGEEMLSAMKEEKQEKTTTTEKQLTEEEKQQVEELKARDMEVKAHEQAHIATGGSYVRGGASYDYQTGPDGKKYAVGGEVSIDTSPVQGDPQATINKAQVVIKAALAPAEPSGQDKAVAAQARQMMANARKELMNEKINGESDSSALFKTENKSESENNKSSVESNDTNNNQVNTSENMQKTKTENTTAENNNTNNTINNINTSPQINTQSLKSDAAYIQPVDVRSSGLFNAFSGAGMSPIKNANALTEVAGSLISLMA